MLAISPLFMGIPSTLMKNCPPLGGLSLAYSINAVTGHALLGCLYKCTDCGTGPLCTLEVGSKQTTLADEIHTLAATKACLEYTISLGHKSPKKPADNTAVYKATSYGFTATMPKATIMFCRMSKEIGSLTSTCSWELDTPLSTNFSKKLSSKVGRFLSLKWCHTSETYDEIVEGASCPSDRKVINSIKSTSCISIRSL